MPTLIPAHVPAKHDLQDLNRFVAQYEGLFGPLADLDFDNIPSTVLRFTMGGAQPAPSSEIVLQTGGKVETPPGQVVVCQGMIFVAGELKLAAALRASA